MKVDATSYGLAAGDDAPSHDAFALQVRERAETVVAVLADGAGGSPRAAEAARRAVESFLAHYACRPQGWAIRRVLEEWAARINRTLHQDSLLRFGTPELVTTLAVAVIDGDRVHGFNVGDSRVYAERGGRLERLSRDHAGESTGLSHVLDRAVGMEAEVRPHFFEAELNDGDRLLLCSDGLTNVLDDETLVRELAGNSPARSLVTLARERAAAEWIDDTSAIVVHVRRKGTLRAAREAALEIPETLVKGESVDGFLLVQPFQQGSRVWLATKGETRWVLKFPPVAARDDVALLDRFLRETAEALRLGETGLFPKAVVPEGATRRYYAMEFVEAPSLKGLLRSRRLSADEAVALGKFLLGAGQRLLRLDLVHGDLKPENILVLPGYDAVRFQLVDAGNVVEVFAEAFRAGTPSYLAPERFAGAPISERTEVYAIGVTLYEALTRGYPYGEVEPFQTPRFEARNPVHPGAANPNLPPWLEAVLLRAVAVDPTRRYQGYSEMLYDLEHPAEVHPFAVGEATFLGWIGRNPLHFYRAGFWLLLAVVFLLLALRLTSHAP